MRLGKFRQKRMFWNNEARSELAHGTYEDVFGICTYEYYLNIYNRFDLDLTSYSIV